MKRITLVVAFVFSLITVFLISTPLYIRSKAAPPGTYYPLIHDGVLIGDYYSDLAIMRQGRTVFAEIDPYTHENVEPTRIHIFYLVLGKLAGALRVSDVAMYYIAEYAAALLYFYFIYKLVRSVVSEKYQWIALFLIYFASPFPQKLINVFGHEVSIGDNWWTYMNAYIRFFLRPIHMWGVMLLVACSYLYLEFIRKQKLLTAITIFALCSIGLVISAVPEFILISVLCFIGLWYGRKVIGKTVQSKERKILLGTGLIIVSAVPILLYVMSLTQTGHIGSVIGAWEYSFRKEVNPTMLLVYLLALGLLLPLGVVSIPSIIRGKKIERGFMLLLAVMPLALYLLSVTGVLLINKLRFAYSAPYVYWGILATFGIQEIQQRVKPRVLKVLMNGAILVVVLANTIIGLAYYWKPTTVEPTQFDMNIYIPTAYMDAINYMNANIPMYSVIFTDFFSGMFIPSFADVKVYIGHETSTIDFGRKQGISNTFYWQGLTYGQVIELFQRDAIDYVLWDKPYPPDKYFTLMRQVFQSDNVILYQVISKKLK